MPWIKAWFQKFIYLVKTFPVKLVWIKFTWRVKLTTASAKSWTFCDGTRSASSSCGAAKKLYFDYLKEQDVPSKCRTDSDKERLTLRHWREAMIKRDIFLKILFVTFEKLAFLITWSIEISNETFVLSGAHSLQFRSYH